MCPVALPSRCAALGLDAAFLRRVREAGAGFGVGVFPVASPADPRFAAADAILLAVGSSGADGVASGGERVTITAALAAEARVVVACVPHGDADGAAQAFAAGADDVVTPRTHGVEVAARIGAAVARRESVRRLEARVRLARPSPAKFVGRSPAAHRVRRIVEHVAGTDAPVRIEGERGTGKTLVATWLHERSPRRHMPLFVVDATRLAAAEARLRLLGGPGDAGALWNARGATVLVRNVELLDAATQLDLAAWIPTRTVPVGPHAGEPSDARLFVTAGAPFQALSAKGKVRPELGAGIAALGIGLPPLRERTGDAVLLLEHFLHEEGQAAVRIDADARRRLGAHAWPGNVSEVRALATLLALRGPCDALDGDTIAPLLDSLCAAAGRPGDLTGVATLHEVSLRHVVRVLALAGGVRGRAAKALGISPRTLYNQLRGIEAERAGTQVPPTTP